MTGDLYPIVKEVTWRHRKRRARTGELEGTAGQQCSTSSHLPLPDRIPERRLMNSATKEIRSFHPLPTRSDAAALTHRRPLKVTREQIKPRPRRAAAWAKFGETALRKVSFETIVNLLLWAVELYVLAFFVRLFLG